MKQRICLFLTLILPLSLFAADIEKEYKKIIENYDVAYPARCVDHASPYTFFSEALSGDQSLKKFDKDMLKNRGAEKEALADIAALPKFYPEFDESIIRSMQGYCDTLLIDMGIAGLPLDCSLHVIYSDDVNAFTAITESGFAMCLTSALLEKRGVTDDVIKDYVANLFAHGALKHHVRRCYAEAKQRRKDKRASAAETAFDILAFLALDEDYYDKILQREYYLEHLKRPEIKIELEQKLPTAWYSFAYSPEQIYEADLMAFRFLENMGCGEEYINGLRILTTVYDQLDESDPTKPLIASRIELLRFAQRNPELGNTQNAKLIRKSQKPR